MKVTAVRKKAIWKSGQPKTTLISMIIWSQYEIWSCWGSYSWRRTNCIWKTNQKPLIENSTQRGGRSQIIFWASCIWNCLSVKRSAQYPTREVGSQWRGNKIEHYLLIQKSYDSLIQRAKPVGSQMQRRKSFRITFERSLAQHFKAQQGLAIKSKVTC